jgi:hypothetical protein
MAKPKKQKFQILLEKDENSEVCGFHVPFNVQEVFGTKARVPVCGTINGFPFRSSIMNMGDGHIMVVNKKLREGAKVKGGDIISVVMERDDAPRIVIPPDDFAKALKKNKDAKAVWDKLSFTHQREYAEAIEEAKKPETRKRRIEKAIETLAAGKTR